MWQDTTDVARDLHRALVPPETQAMARRRSNFELRRNNSRLLYPSVGVSSDTTKPGGFRRAHIKEKGEGASEYAARPLVAHLTPEHAGRVPMVTGAVLVLPDGTEVVYHSRAFRRGHKPTVLMMPDGSTPTPSPHRYLAWRPRSIPYWGSLSYLLGAILFVEGSLAWMVPSIGDEENGAPPELAHATVAWPYLIGSILFGIGCYLAFVEVINANLEQEITEAATGGLLDRQLRDTLSIRSGSSTASAEFDRIGATRGFLSRTPSSKSVYTPKKGRLPTGSWLQRPLLGSSRPRLGSSLVTSLGSESPIPEDEEVGAKVEESPAPSDSCIDWLRSLSWWQAQPASLLWWGVLLQLIGGLLFIVCCYGGMPGAADHLPALLPGAVAVTWVYTPCLLGSFTFVFASAVYVMEEWNDRPNLGYHIAVLNLVGSVLFLLASFGYYFADASLMPFTPDVLFLISEWTVRFPFAVGSACFGVGAVLALGELLDADEADPQADEADIIRA